MTQQQSYLDEIQKDHQYQLQLREFTDKSAQGLLTLLVTVNAAAFVSVVEMLKAHHWLLILFISSTISALIARTTVYYTYRCEIDTFENATSKDKVKKLNKQKMLWWVITQWSAWLSLISFIIGLVLLTLFFNITSNVTL